MDSTNYSKDDLVKEHGISDKPARRIAKLNALIASGEEQLKTITFGKELLVRKLEVARELLAETVSQ